YVIESPLAGAPTAEVWAHAFHRDDPSRAFGVKRTFPLTELRREGIIGIGEARFEEGHLSGALAEAGHTISWDLRYDPSPTSVHLVPWPLRALGVARTVARFHNLATHFSGAMYYAGVCPRL